MDRVSCHKHKDALVFKESKWYNQGKGANRERKKHIGLYCGECRKWIKWASSEEERHYPHESSLY